MSNKKRGMLIVLSGPSGAGKDTILKRILEQRNDIKLSISYTTRVPREGELHGKDYYFVDKDRFIEVVDNGQMLEYAVYCGNYYGTPLIEIEKELENGKNVILEIEVQGAMQVLEKYPNILSIFIAPPSLDSLYHRLVKRGLDSAETINQRILLAEKEMQLSSKYKYVTVNDDIEKCTQEIINIIDSENI